ncbi:MAG: hypothetical protein HQ490_07625 [Lutibacter sp.]|nr:hypothetical protein [Lutibacter sp.]
MSAFLKDFDQYWQTVANTNKKLVPQKQIRKAVVLNYVNKEIQELKFEVPELEEVVEERACVLASDIELPFEWAYAVTKLRNIQKPRNIPSASWLEIENACSMLYADNFALLKAIVGHDWSLHDIYGCSSNNPCSSFDNMGLLLLLKPTDKVIEVRKDSIKIRSKSGSISSFYPRLERGIKIALLHELL